MKRKEKLQAILAKKPEELEIDEQKFLRINAQFLSREEMVTFSRFLNRKDLQAEERVELRRLILLDKLFPRPIDWTQDDENREANADGVAPLLIARNQ